MINFLGENIVSDVKNNNFSTNSLFLSANVNKQWITAFSEARC